METILESSRLVLRKFVQSDFDSLSRMHEDPEVMHFWPRPYTREETQVFLERMWERYERDGYGLYAAVLQESGEVVGRIGYLRQEVDDRPDLEIGYMLAREQWGKGLAAEAARALRDHAFSLMDVDRIISLIRPDNVRSRRVAESNGMRVLKEVQHASLFHLMYAITADEWRNRVAASDQT